MGCGRLRESEISVTNMRNKKRAPIKAATKHLLNDQFKSACAVCRDATSAKLEIHHIDGDTQNPTFENLMILCGGCHNEFTLGTKNEADARMFKRMAETGHLAPRKDIHILARPGGQFVNKGINNGVMADVVHIKNLKVQRNQAGKSSRELPGTIGADVDMRTYATYLVGKYIKCRQDGEKWIKQYRRPFNPASAHGILGEGYGVTNSVLQIPQTLFFRWMESAQNKIRRTIFAKNLGHEFFHSWEEHLRRRGR
jgi:hypothetical protein